MAKLSSLLNERFLKKEKNKTSDLAQKSVSGTLSSFSGIFGSAKLSQKETEHLDELLKKYAPEDEIDSSQDYHSLLAITTEVKAINNQAVMLHGERIKKAGEILKRYKDGAFTSWLLMTYGNRQTPYNFLQYYEFFTTMPAGLHPQIEEMPRQAIYSLASRMGSLEKKEEIIRNYQGETKEELLALIRISFPLDEKDGRREDIAVSVASTLKKLITSLNSKTFSLSTKERKALFELIEELKRSLEKE